MREKARDFWVKLKNKIKALHLPTYEAVFSICILTLPLTVQYTSPISLVSFGELALILILTYGILKEGVAYLTKIRALKSERCLIMPQVLSLNPISKGLLCISLSFVYITCITSVYSSEYFQWSESFTIILRMITYFFAIMFATKYFNIKSVEKLYLAIVYLMAAYLFVQVIYYYAAADSANRYLPIYLKFEWLHSSEQMSYRQDLSNYYGGGFYGRFRPSALFLEANYYAFFMVPALYYVLIKKKQLFPSLFLYASLILSTSGAGFLMGSFAYVVYMVGALAKKKEGKLHFNAVPCVCFIVAVFAAVMYFRIDSSRIISAFSSFNVRVTLGLHKFETLGLFHKCFGIGMNHLSVYALFYQTWHDYAFSIGGSFSMGIVQYGIIGGMIFIGFYVYLLLNCRHRKFALLFAMMFIVYTVTDSCIFNSHMCYILSFVCYFYRIESAAISKKPMADCLLR